jgi:hypothetical protein
MKRTTIALLVALSTATQANDWIDVAQSRGNVWSFKRQSGQFDRTTEGTPVYVALFQTRHADGSVSVERKYVPLQDCVDGYGTVVTINTGTGNVMYRNDFAIGGNSVASMIGTTICLGAKKHAEREGGTGQRY